MGDGWRQDDECLLGIAELSRYGIHIIGVRDGNALSLKRTCYVRWRTVITSHLCAKEVVVARNSTHANATNAYEVDAFALRIVHGDADYLCWARAITSRYVVGRIGSSEGRNVVTKSSETLERQEPLGLL